MGALRADGEEDSKPTTLGPVRRHYGQTEKENQGHAPLVFPHRLTLCLTVPFSPLVSPYRFPLSSHRTVFPSRLPVPFSPLVSPYRFPLSSPRTVFPSRLPVNFLYGAKWLWFYGFKEPTPTPLGPVLGHYGQTKKEVQNQRRLGPYGGITGRRRRRFKTNDAWARMEALRADGEEDSKPTTLGPVRRHYGQTERGITGRRRGALIF